MLTDVSRRFLDVYAYLKDNGLVRSQREFTEKIGISPSMFTEICKHRSNVGIAPVQNIVSEFNINADWLLTGRGEMIRQNDIQLADVKVEHKFNLRTDNDIDIQRIPLYEIDATAGILTIFSDLTTQTPIDYLTIPNLPPCDGAVFVKGDSMYPILKSGDIVLYKQIHNIDLGILWGEMYIVSFEIDGEEYLSIKYIQKTDDDNYIRLVSQNQYHAPKEIPLHCVRALAMIKASVRYNTMG